MTISYNSYGRDFLLNTDFEIKYVFIEHFSYKVCTSINHIFFLERERGLFYSDIAYNKNSLFTSYFDPFGLGRYQNQVFGLVNLHWFAFKSLCK